MGRWLAGLESLETMKMTMTTNIPPPETRLCKACGHGFPLEEFPLVNAKDGNGSRRHFCAPCWVTRRQALQRATRALKRGEPAPEGSPEKIRNKNPVRITDEMIKGTTPPPEGESALRLKDNQVDGLIFLIYPSGRGSWALRYSDADGAEHLITIGRGSIPVNEARTLARRFLKRISGTSNGGHDKMKREFLRDTKVIDGTPRALKVIRCRECGATEEMRQAPDEVCRSQFAGRGWLIGNNVERDTCPACAAPSKKKEEETVTNTLSILLSESPAPTKLELTEMTTHVPAPEKADRLIIGDPLAKPTRVEISRIIDGLSEAYPLVDKGYDDGWTDEKVAFRLQMPVAWIAAERERSFGPAVVVDFGDYRETLDGIAKEIAGRVGHGRRGLAR